jgi:broad specificity phosphatase PhoE
VSIVGGLAWKWLTKHSWQGQKDTLLNEEGRQQAAAVARKLSEVHKQEPFDILVASPLCRAVPNGEIVIYLEA